MIGSKRYWRARHRAALGFMAGLLPEHQTKYVDQLFDHVLAWPSAERN